MSEWDAEWKGVQFMYAMPFGKDGATTMYGRVRCILYVHLRRT